DLRLHLNLVDAGELVFDRIFDRDDVADRRVELEETGVEGRRLAAAGRPSHQHHAVRQIEYPLQRLADIIRQPKLHKIELDGCAIEHAQHNAFAIERGDRRNPKIDLLPAHREANAPILRQTALGDIEPRHDLDPRDDGRPQARRRRLGLVQRAVIAVTDAQSILERLNMNVRRSGLDRAGDQLIDEADNRRFARQVFQPLGILVARFDIADDLVRAAGAAFTSGLTLGIKTVKGGFELDRDGDRNRDRPAKRRGRAIYRSGATARRRAARRLPPPGKEWLR